MFVRSLSRKSKLDVIFLHEVRFVGFELKMQDELLQEWIVLGD